MKKVNLFSDSWSKVLMTRLAQLFALFAIIIFVLVENALDVMSQILRDVEKLIDRIEDDAAAILTKFYDILNL